MDQEELKNILELHRKWVMGEAGGSRANLVGANLRSANLRSANLVGANLRSANLGSANLRSANLGSANLRSANLRSANLRSANLRSANLYSANLVGADLGSANLRSANLYSANLGSADLRSIKKDFFERLEIAKNEALGLYDALSRGLVDGSCYEGECACFVGTIANIRKENYQKLGIDLRPDADSATERWFMAIRRGDIPQSNQVSNITAGWLREFMDQHGIKYPRYEIRAVQDRLRGLGNAVVTAPSAGSVQKVDGT